MANEYFKNLDDARISACRYSLHYRDPVAWDNRKAKITRKSVPRGPAIARMESLRFSRLFREIAGDIEAMESFVEKASAR